MNEQPAPRSRSTRAGRPEAQLLQDPPGGNVIRTALGDDPAVREIPPQCFDDGARRLRGESLSVEWRVDPVTDLDVVLASKVDADDADQTSVRAPPGTDEKIASVGAAGDQIPCIAQGKGLRKEGNGFGYHRVVGELCQRFRILRHQGPQAESS